MSNIVDFKKKSSKTIKKEETNSIHLLNLKLQYMASLTELISQADNNEHDVILRKSYSYRAKGQNGDYIITITKV